MRPTTKKVLLADDHSLIVEGLIKLLETDSMYEVIGIAKNGKEAWDIYEKHNPEICILDIEMAHIDGIELTEKIKAKNPKTIVILITMHKSPWIIAHALNAKPNSILLKNMNCEDLHAAINSTVSTGSYFHSDVLGMIEHNSQRIDNILSVTSREREVLALIAEGLTTQTIADRLCLSVNTVETYRKNLLLKFGAPNMVGLIKKATDLGVI
ncbi:MAG TPA: response regulator transcription factor [Salinivirgaceae bacterium]|nr:response regulator transcription factor [Salinivirgaceae bacterium]